MGVEYNKEREKWGYRFRLHKKTYKRYVYNTRAEAMKAEREKHTEIEKLPVVKELSLQQAVNDFLIASIRRGRSKWRTDALFLNFDRFIIPHFGQTIPLSQITPAMVEEFMRRQLLRVSPSTVWHYVMDLKALLNFFGVKPNPVALADRTALKFRKKPKPVFDLSRVETAAEALTGYDRAYFDFCRFTGAHKDEANGVRWEDVDLTRELVRIRGTKNEYRDRFVPLHPVLVEELKSLPRNSEWVFPNQKTGKRQYRREKFLKRVEKLSGVKLTVKDLRDYFATVVARHAITPDQINSLRDMLGHRSLNTTQIYIRRVLGDTHAADLVRSIGATSGGHPGANSTKFTPPPANL